MSPSSDQSSGRSCSSLDCFAFIERWSEIKAVVMVGSIAQNVQVASRHQNTFILCSLSFTQHPFAGFKGASNMMHVEANEWSILAANEFLATLYRIYTVHPYWTSNMAFYRIGRSITMTRTLKREIKRKGQYMSESAICKLLKQRSFGRAVSNAWTMFSERDLGLISFIA